MVKSVFVVVLDRTNRVLLVKSKATWKQFGGKRYLRLSKWGLPGGQQEVGESEVATALREVREESGFKIEIEPGIEFREQKKDRQIVTLWGVTVGGRISTETSETTDCGWFYLNRLPPKMFRSHQRRLREILSLVGI